MLRLALLFCLAASCASSPKGPLLGWYYYSGSVKDAGTGRPVAGARVRVSEERDNNRNGRIDVYDAVTGATGWFQVRVRGEGESDAWSLDVVADGYDAGHLVRPWKWNLTSDSPAIAAHVLVDPSAEAVTAVLTVRGTETGETLSGVMLAADALRPFAAATDETGRASFRLVRGRTYSFVCFRPGEAPRKEVVVAKSDPWLQTFVLPARHRAP